MIYGWMHVATMGDWQTIWMDQCEALTTSGLGVATQKIHVGAVGARAKRLHPPSNRFDVVYQGLDEKEFEFPTLQHLWRFCRDKAAPEDLVWYVHSKGASWKGSPDWLRQGQLWRKYMEYFVFHRHRDCVAALAGHDCVGTHFRHHRFFAGNFWWARADHVARLGEPISGDRMYAEKWLFTSEPPPRVLSMFDVPYENPGLQPVSAAEYALATHWERLLTDWPDKSGWVSLLVGLWALRPNASLQPHDRLRLLHYVLGLVWPTQAAYAKAPVQVWRPSEGDVPEPLDGSAVLAAMCDSPVEHPRWRLAWRQQGDLPAALYEAV